MLQNKLKKYYFLQAKHAAHGDIHHGSLSDICTIYRTDNVIVGLDTAQKKVSLQFPFKFDDLKVNAFLFLMVR